MPYFLLPTKQSIYYQLHHPSKASKGILVFLNGVGMSAQMWSPCTSAFTDDYTILTWDLLGQKMSDKFYEDQEISFAEQVGHLHCLLDYLKLGPAHLIGTSYGAETAIYFAAAYPHKTLSLTVITATGEISPLQRVICGNWIAACERGMYGLLQEMLPWNYSSSYLALHSATLMARWEGLSRVPDDFTNSFIKLAHSFLQLNCRPITNKIHCPTLIIAAADDILKPIRCSQSLQEQIVNAQLEIILDCGHAAVFEQPQRIVRIIQNFFSKLA